MTTLSKDWLTEGYIDFEYKKYVLLAWLQKVENSFTEAKLYPFMGDLVEHYRNLIELQTRYELLSAQFPASIKEVDWQNLKLVYEKNAVGFNHAVIEELRQIIDFSIPELKTKLEEGSKIYQLVEDQLKIEPIGLLPLYKDEGYLLFSNGGTGKVSAYQYKLGVFSSAEVRYRGISLRLINEFDRPKTQPLESLKMTLVKSYSALPNPATWYVYSNHSFPETETLVPVAKRSFIKYLVTESQ